MVKETKPTEKKWLSGDRKKNTIAIDKLKVLKSADKAAENMRGTKKKWVANSKALAEVLRLRCPGISYKVAISLVREVSGSIVECLLRYGNIRIHNKFSMSLGLFWQKGQLWENVPVVTIRTKLHRDVRKLVRRLIERDGVKREECEGRGLWPIVGRYSPLDEEMFKHVRKQYGNKEEGLD